MSSLVSSNPSIRVHIPPSSPQKTVAVPVEMSPEGLQLDSSQRKTVSHRVSYPLTTLHTNLGLQPSLERSRSFEQEHSGMRRSRSDERGGEESKQQLVQAVAAAMFSPAIKAQNGEQLAEQLFLGTPAKERWGISRHSLPAPTGETPEQVKRLLEEPLEYNQSVVAKFMKAINSLMDPAHRNELILRLSGLFVEKAAAQAIPPETVFTSPDARANLHPALALAALSTNKQKHVNTVQNEGARFVGGHFLSCYKGKISHTVIDIAPGGVYCLEVGPEKVYKTCFPSEYENIEAVLASAVKDQEKLIAVGEFTNGTLARYVRLGKENDYLSFAILLDDKNARATIYPLYGVQLLTREQTHYRIWKAVLTYEEIKAEIDRQYENAEHSSIFYYKNSEGKLCAIFDVAPAFKKRTGIPSGVCFVREVRDPAPAQPAFPLIAQVCPSNA